MRSDLVALCATKGFGGVCLLQDGAGGVDDGGLMRTASTTAEPPETTLPELEITSIPPLAPGEVSLLDLHSAINVLNVLRNELAVLGIMVANNENHFLAGILVCDRLLQSQLDRDVARNAALEIEQSQTVVLDELDRRMPASIAPELRAETLETQQNIRTVFGILRTRARELLARAAHPERWEAYDCQEMEADLRRVFAAIEQNSKGRYRILFNAARQHPSDYYVDLRIEAPDGVVRMPAVFRDVMRDLVANARKYTPAGGHITLALFEDADALRFVVEDNGRGIPWEEIPKVVEFGKRGSNVGEVRTLGGGFGLTKAFFVTKQFGGRFWIASKLGRGTRVRIRIPRPAEA